MAKHNKTGKIGEEIATNWLVSKNYTVLERNYQEKWGEIDIIATRATKLHFVEVKTVSYETRGQLHESISHGTWRPEEMVHRDKLQKLGRAIETWLTKHPHEGDWQIDVLTVRLVSHEKYAQIKLIDNVILE